MISRQRRMQGYNVLNPMELGCFRFACRGTPPSKAGVHPGKWTRQNIKVHA
ncbi:MAG: hypothetical protein R3C24_14555 [Cyanobacteriota/Melainabacteria group bacterium]